MERPKGKFPSIEDAKLGNVSDEWQEYFAGIAEICCPHLKQAPKHLDDAKALLELLHGDSYENIERHISDNPPSTGVIAFLVVLAEEAYRSRKARHAADKLHSRPNGSREKQEKIRAIWASGKYTSKDRCAEEECGELDMSFTSARKALRNT